MQLLKTFITGILAVFATSSFVNARTRLVERVIPTTVIAGVIVPDTPIVQAAQAYARAHGDNMTFNHVMRSWLFSTIVINNNATLRAVVDPETHAVATILHDLGWDNTGELISEDKRFEIDGAIAARNFIEAAVANGTAGHDWDENRIQLVWDAIALHTSYGIFPYKQPVVAMTGTGVDLDIGGPDADPTHSLTWDSFNTIKEEFPRLDLGPSVSKKICGLARTKPATTYDNWQMAFGFRYVGGYKENAKGKLAIDLVEAALPN